MGGGDGYMTADFEYYDPRRAPRYLLALAAEAWPGRELLALALVRAGSHPGRAMAALALRSWREHETDRLVAAGGHELVACLAPRDAAPVPAALRAPPPRPAAQAALAAV